MPSAPRAERRWRRRAGLAAVALALASVTFYPLCDRVFDCGCTWPLLGGGAHCDIHVAGPPDCPVCTRPAVGAAFSAAVLGGWGALVWAGAGLLARARRPRAPGA